MTFFFFSGLFFSASGDDLLLFLPDSRSESDLPLLQLAPNIRPDSPRSAESHDFSLRLIDSRSESGASATLVGGACSSSSRCSASSVLKSPGCDVSESPSRLVSSSLL